MTHSANKLVPKQATKQKDNFKAEASVTIQATRTRNQKYHRKTSVAKCHPKHDCSTTRQPVSLNLPIVRDS